MRTGRSHRIKAVAALAASGALALPAAAQAAEPTFATNGVSHISGTSAQLEGTVTPEGIATSYFFEYGPLAGGRNCEKPMAVKTKPTAVPIPAPPAKSVKVGQSVTGLLAGYHYRIIGVYTNLKGEAKTGCGREKTFTNSRLTALKFALSKEREDRVYAVYGGAAEIVGSLKGSASANHGLTMQSTVFPFTSPFTTVPGTIFTSRSGTFAVKVFGLLANTEYRFLTIDPRPVISPTVTVRVIPRITLHVKRGGSTRLFRLYGTVTPARNGASIAIQQLLPQKAGSKREGPRARTIGTTVLKRQGSRASRFSVVIRLAGTFHYRAYVRLPKGALESGPSANVLVKAPAETTKQRK